MLKVENEVKDLRLIKELVFILNTKKLEHKLLQVFIII